MPKAKATLTLNTFRAANTPGRGGGCSLAIFLDSLSPEDQETVESAIRDSSIQTRAIHRVISRMGFSRGENVVLRHRRGSCAVCER